MPPSPDPRAIRLDVDRILQRLREGELSPAVACAALRSKLNLAEAPLLAGDRKHACMSILEGILEGKDAATVPALLTCLLSREDQALANQAIGRLYLLLSPDEFAQVQTEYTLG